MSEHAETDETRMVRELLKSSDGADIRYRMDSVVKMRRSGDKWITDETVAAHLQAYVADHVREPLHGDNGFALRLIVRALARIDYVTLAREMVAQS